MAAKFTAMQNNTFNLVRLVTKGVTNVRSVAVIHGQNVCFGTVERTIEKNINYAYASYKNPS